MDDNIDRLALPCQRRKPDNISLTLTLATTLEIYSVYPCHVSTWAEEMEGADEPIHLPSVTRRYLK
jgi:hypothetical protein